MEEKNRYQLRYAAGVYWLLDMEQTGRAYRKPIVMNECGAYIWENYSQQAEEDRIADLLHERYGISREEAAADVNQFIGELKEQGVSCERKVK